MTRCVWWWSQRRRGPTPSQFLTTVLLLITTCRLFVHVESSYFRSLADVTISAQNARRYVVKIYLSIVDTIRGVLKKVVDVSMGLKMFWWNADLLANSFRLQVGALFKFKLAAFLKSAHHFKEGAQYDCDHIFQVLFRVSALFQGGVGRAIRDDGVLLKLDFFSKTKCDQNEHHFYILLSVSIV